MFRTPRRRIRPDRRVLRLEALEARLALAGVVATVPAAGSVLSSSPGQILVRFDEPIADYTVGVSDVILERVQDDGSAGPALDDPGAILQNLDPESTGLTLDLGQPLGPGRYRIVLSGSSMLTTPGGTLMSPEDGLDRPLAEFTIERPGVTLADATDLGPLGPGGRVLPGSLDLASDSGAVALYRVTLPRGHFWRLGAEVTAERDGGPLDAALALFDASGLPLATAEMGRPDAPSDPYLFAGLAEGTYYVAVSGAGNLPGEPGGYDLARGRAGAARVSAGGAFTLFLVADEANSPGHLMEFRLDHADPLDPTPTGLSLRFSEAMAPVAPGPGPHDPSTGGIEVVDDRGASWPVTAASYDAARGAIGFLFHSRLPEGHYTVRLSPRAPLRDLAGHLPEAPDHPAGVLATFEVGADPRARQRDGTLAADPPAGLAPATLSQDLGPLAPDSAASGFRRVVALAPGTSFLMRFVSLQSNFYRLALEHRGGPLRMEIRGASAASDVAIEASAEPRGTSLYRYLEAGTYYVRIEATGDASATFAASLEIPAFSWESLLFNGMGQGPALNLRLVAPDGPSWAPPGPAPVARVLASSEAPAPVAPGTAPVAGSIEVALMPSGPVAGPSLPPPPALAAQAATLAAMGLNVAPTASPSAGGGGAAGPSGLPLDLESSLVGRPSPEADRVAVVEPAGPRGAVAIALAARGPVPSRRAGIPPRGISSADRSVVPPPGRPGDEPGPSETPAPAPEEAPAAIPGVGAEILETAAETPEGSPTDRAADARAGLLAPPAEAAPESQPEAEAEPAIPLWGLGLLGVAALIGRRFLKARAARRKPRALPAYHRPAPHRSPGRVPA